MNSTTTSQEILNLEKKYWDAMKDNDVETAVSLTKFPCIISSPKGVQRVSEYEYRQMMSSSNGDSFKGIEIQDPQVDVLADGTALISYSIKHNGMKMQDVSTWIRDGEKWVCAFHAENPIQ